MPLLFPNGGENIALEALVNKTAGQNLVLRLFSNNITPAETDVAATYTEATFAGYAAITLTGANWNTGTGTVTYNAQQTFTRSTTGTVENIYGYYCTQLASGLLVYAERDAAAPAAITNSGDNIKLTPAITAD